MAEIATSLDDINLKVADLLNSKHPEHHALAEKCRSVLQELVDKGKPILRLMTTPHEMIWSYGSGRSHGQVSLDCLELGVEKLNQNVTLRLFLTDGGHLIEVTQFVSEGTLEIRGEKDSVYLTKAGTNDSRQLWERILFAEIISNLSKALAEARNRHGCLVEDVEEKMNIIDQALAVLKGGS